MVYRLGIDAGSTTVKLVLLDEENKIIYKSYTRHLTKVRETVLSELSKIKDIVNNNKIKLCFNYNFTYLKWRKYEFYFGAFVQAV
mgnify:CR=1 FL=1